MKYLFILSLFFSSLAYGQIPTPCTRCWPVAAPVHFDDDTVYFPSFFAVDTLIIDPAHTRIKFIRFGDKIYSLNKETSYLEEVKPISLATDSAFVVPITTGWTSIGNLHVLVDSSFIPSPMEKVCRNLSDTRKQGWTAQPWPAILWRKADGTYLDHKKHPLKPWIRVWEN